jgi:hypothetical protein
MANPTTNYGWPMPTSSDLVTDLPADFAAFGQPVDTSLKALNPETTLGDISYRSATANTNTRLAIGTTGQVLTVASGVPSWATPAGSSFTWTSYTPTVSAQTGSITTYTATGKYLTVGKGVFFIFYITLTTVGTATGNLIVTLPITSVGGSAGSVYESNNTGTSGPVSISGNSAQAISRNYAATTWFANGAVLVGSIYYEVA